MLLSYGTYDWQPGLEVRNRPSGPVTVMEGGAPSRIQFKLKAQPVSSLCWTVDHVATSATVGLISHAHAMQVTTKILKRPRMNTLQVGQPCPPHSKHTATAWQLKPSSRAPVIA